MARIATADLSPYLSSRPYESAVVPASERRAMRQNTKITGASKRRFRYTYSGKNAVCVLCGLHGSWNVEIGDPARLEIGHTVPLVMYGASNCTNLRPQHAACNAAAGDRDLTSLVGVAPQAWASLSATERWERTPNARLIPSDLPTESDMEAARLMNGCYF